MCLSSIFRSPEMAQSPVLDANSGSFHTDRVPSVRMLFLHLTARVFTVCSWRRVVEGAGRGGNQGQLNRETQKPLYLLCAKPPLRMRTLYPRSNYLQDMVSSFDVQLYSSHVPVKYTCFSIKHFQLQHHSTQHHQTWPLNANRYVHVQTFKMTRQVEQRRPAKNARPVPPSTQITWVVLELFSRNLFADLVLDSCSQTMKSNRITQASIKLYPTGFRYWSCTQEILNDQKKGVQGFLRVPLTTSKHV
jgi:hypothetical protein